MPELDKEQREKWPTPQAPEPISKAEKELDIALKETGTDPLRAKARAVQALLRQEYGEPRWPVLDPLGTLIEI